MDVRRYGSRDLPPRAILQARESSFVATKILRCDEESVTVERVWCQSVSQSVSQSVIKSHFFKVVVPMRETDNSSLGLLLLGVILGHSCESDTLRRRRPNAFVSGASARRIAHFGVAEAVIVPRV